MIRFGPAGLGGVKEAVGNLEMYKELGLKACEIAFTYGIYIKNKKDAIEIGKAAKRLGINLSIHAPYWINLNSEEQEKIEKSKERILRCCEVGDWLQATRVIFHPGYYGKKEKSETYETIKNKILEMQEIIKGKNWKIKLAPETTGKKNVFGSIDEIYQLVEQTSCSFCIDFAHILARYNEYKFDEIFEKFKKHKKFHIHFSGMEYGEKGERYHKRTEKKELKKLIDALPKNKDVTIINESPSPVEDSVFGARLDK